MVLILSKEFRQAEALALKLGLNSQQWRFIRDSSSLIGLRGITVLMWADYWHRKDFEEISDLIQASSCFRLHIKDDRDIGYIKYEL